MRRMWLMFDPTKVINRYSRIMRTRKASALAIINSSGGFSRNRMVRRKGPATRADPNSLRTVENQGLPSTA
jgi:hypothetical protein